VSSHTQNERDQDAETVPQDDSEAQEQALMDNSDTGAEAETGNGDRAHESIPRWRQIEIMRERAQLREALGDLDDDFDELDELEREVFGSESENDVFYHHGMTDIDEDLELDDEDEDMDDDDFEDFEED
jgi:hypothetical protein